MSGAEWLVLAAGGAAIVWLNWYFFVAPARAAVSVASTTGRSEITIAVHGGYDPSVILVRAGQPLRLTFDRQETNSCSEELVLPDFGIRVFLPAFQKTTVEILPKQPGKYAISCGMSMLHGTIIAE
jgi:plastocyanin domain-containing protein